jgi:hypothetical protein
MSAKEMVAAFRVAIFMVEEGIREPWPDPAGVVRSVREIITNELR